MKTANFLKRMVMTGFAAGAVVIGLQAQPASYQQHGNNSLGNPSAQEAIDSVTVGGTIGYFVMPDLDINQDGDGQYNYSTNADALFSTFDWWTSSGDAVNDVSAENVVNVTWSAVSGGTPDSIYVTEISASSCPGADTTVIPVNVIAVPTVTGGAAPAAQCTSDPSTLTFAVPLTLTTDVAGGNIRINYTVTNPDASELIAAQDLDMDEAATSFNQALTGASQYGDYTVTINAVSDHISRKSSVTGTITTATITLTVNRIPATGEIYHIPNQ